MDKNTIEKILNAALDELYKNDQDLIFCEKNENDGDGEFEYKSERSIVCKYVQYFDVLIKEIDIDCDYRVDTEYNRNIDKPKITPSRPNGAYPDMILHKRGTNKHNILVAEFKTWWNKDKKELDKDIKKLEDFLNQKGEYRYDYGVSIILGKKREDVRINFIDPLPPAKLS